MMEIGSNNQANQPGAQGQPNQANQPGAQGQPSQRYQPGAQGQPNQRYQPGAQGQPNQGYQPGAQGQPNQGYQPGAQGQPNQRYQPGGAQGRPNQANQPRGRKANAVQHKNRPVRKNKKEKTPYTIDNSDKAFAWVMVLAAFIGVESFNIFCNHGNYGFGATLFVVLYAVSVLIYSIAGKVKIGVPGLFWLAVIVITGMSYSFVYNESMQIFIALFLRLTMMYYTLAVGRALIAEKTSGFALIDSVNMLFVVPILNFPMQWRATIGETNHDEKIGWNILKATLGVLIGFPLLFMIFLLLASADSGFNDLMYNLFHNLFTEWIGKLFGHAGLFILSLPVGCYLFGLAYGSIRKRYADSFDTESLKGAKESCRVIPGACIYTVHIMISLMYIIFIGVQIVHYIDVSNNILPSGFTYSDYARNGFFELVTISIINIIIVGCTQTFAKKWGLIMRLLNALMAVLTLCIIGIALIKMYMYIEAYGLTPLRVIPSLAMIMLAVIFLLMLVDQAIEIPVIRISICVFALGFALLTVGNMDGFIASYNVDRYMNGTLKEIDQDVMEDCSLSAVPALYEAWQTTDEDSDKETIRVIVKSIKDNEESVLKKSHNIKYSSVVKIKTEKMINEILQ